MKILVTGANGFVGKQLTAIIDSPICIIRNNEKHDFDNVISIDSINGNTQWSGCFYGIDVIVHLAGVAHVKCEENDVFQSVNTKGTLHLATEAAKVGVKRFVFVSSIGVNGTFTDSTPFKYDDDVNPHNDYAQSKLDAEIGLRKIAQDSGMEVVIVRPTLVYGSDAPGNFGVLTKLVRLLPILPFGLTNNKRSFIAVQNLADLLVKCATHPRAGGHTFLASESETVSTREFTNAIAKGLGKKVYQLPIPIKLLRFVGKLLRKSAMIEQLVGNLQVDSSDLKKVLGWTPPYTMEESMALLKEQSKER